MTTGGQWPPPEYGEQSSTYGPGSGDGTPSPGEQPTAETEPTAEPTGGQPPRAGSISFQDPSTTVPREPTLAERRAREHAERERQASEAAWWDEQAKRAKRRKRILVGGAVGVGLVAVIALSYSSSHPQAEQARCVGADNVVVDDNNCVQPAASTGYNSGFGGGLIPIFIGGGGRQYHYTYGGSGGIGQVATGGTTVAPRGTVTTTSGRTISPGTSGSSSGSGSRSGSFGSGSGSDSEAGSGSSSVRRGGFGVSSHGSSSGS